MTKIKMHPGASTIINILNENGFDAYIVGGCVRDSLLGLTPNDWDICTPATPQQVLNCFKYFQTIETGIKHGTVTVILNNTPFEITTYRVDGKYSDSRHPDAVSFVKDIREDLKRRDITINAMAYNDKEGLIDFFDGQKDLYSKIIRCVGNPNDRFKEDALRILRVLRFASTYNFNIDKETSNGLFNNKALLKNIAAERINKELCKLISGAGAKSVLLSYKEIIGEIIPEIKPCFNFDQNNPHHEYDVYTHIITALDNYKGDDLIVKLAILLHDIGKPECYSEDEFGGHFYKHNIISSDISKEILKRLRFDTHTVSAVSTLILHHDTIIDTNKKSIKRWLNKIGETQLKRLLDVQGADLAAHSTLNRDNKFKILDSLKLILENILFEEECFSLKNLDINGKDLIDLGIKEGPEIGSTLNHILELVIEEKIENKKSEIIKILR